MISFILIDTSGFQPKTLCVNSLTRVFAFCRISGSMSSWLPIAILLLVTSFALVAAENCNIAQYHCTLRQSYREEIGSLPCPVMVVSFHCNEIASDEVAGYCTTISGESGEVDSGLQKPRKLLCRWPSTTTGRFDQMNATSKK